MIFPPWPPPPPQPAAPNRAVPARLAPLTFKKLRRVSFRCVIFPPSAKAYRACTLRSRKVRIQRRALGPPGRRAHRSRVFLLTTRQRPPPHRTEKGASLRAAPAVARKSRVARTYPFSCATVRPIRVTLPVGDYFPSSPPALKRACPFPETHTTTIEIAARPAWDRDRGSPKRSTVWPSPLQ